MAKIKLIELYKCVELALVTIGVGKAALETYQYLGFRPLKRFFEERDCAYYSKKLADEFVENTLNAYKSDVISVSRYRCIRKVVTMLDEYNETGTIQWRQLPMYGVPSLTCKNFENILTRYLEDISGKKGYALSTIKRHRCTVKQFLLYLEGHGYRSLVRLTRKTVSAYIPFIAKKQASGISDMLCVLKMFLTFLHESKYIDSELVSALPRYPAKRNKHFAGFTQPRSVPITAKTAEHIKRYIQKFHSRQTGRKDDYLFYTTMHRERRQMSCDNIERFMKKYGQSARNECRNLPENVHPHQLRHTRAIHLYRNGMPMAIISEFLGHANVSTSQIYAYADPETKRKAIRKAKGEELIDTPEALWQTDEEMIKRLYGLK